MATPAPPTLLGNKGEIQKEIISSPHLHFRSYTSDLLPATLTTQFVWQQQQGVPTTVIGPSQNIRASTRQPVIMSPGLYGGGLISGLNSPTNDMPSLVSIGQSLPLLPWKLIQQIKVGEYIDFSDLPPAKGRQLTPTNYNSQLVLVQLEEVERQRKLIRDFLTWPQCFAIYTTVLGADQPHQLPEFMAYQIKTAKCAKKYKWPSWIIYDINFRKVAAGRLGLSWASVESSIYTQCFTCMAKDPSDVWCRNCQSLDHGTATCPIMPQSKIPRRDRLISEPKREAGGKQRRTQYAETTTPRVVPTLTAPGVTCAGTVTKNTRYQNARIPRRQK